MVTGHALIKKSSTHLSVHSEIVCAYQARVVQERGKDTLALGARLGTEVHRP